MSKLLPELVGYKLKSEMDMKIVKNIFRENESYNNQRDDTCKQENKRKDFQFGLSILD